MRRIEANRVPSALGLLTALAITLWYANVSTLRAASPESSSKSAAAIFQRAELTGSDLQQDSFFGSAVAISGNTIVVGAPGNAEVGHNVPGAAYVFVKPTGGWHNMTQIAKLTTSDGGSDPGNRFGSSVAISGNTIVVGSFFDKAYVFVMPATGWADMTETAQLINSCFSCDVAIDGDTVVVGAPADELAGEAAVFVRPATGWQSTAQPNATLTESIPTMNDGFGSSVASSGNTIVATVALNGGSSAVCLFVQPAGGWSGHLVPTATLSSTEHHANFFSVTSGVSISGNTVATGSPDGENFSFVDVWVKPAAGWRDMIETAQLTDGRSNDGFGTSTAVAGDRIVVGRGAEPAFLFKKPLHGWKTTDKWAAALKASNRTDNFGTSVATSGSTTVVGAPGGFDFRNLGAAYVFVE